VDSSISASSGQYQPPSQYPAPQPQYQPYQYQPESAPAPAPHLYQPEPPSHQYQPSQQTPGIFNPADTAQQPSPGLPPPSIQLERQPDQPGPGFVPVVSSGYGWNDPPPATVAKNAFSRQTAPAPQLAEPISTSFFTPEPVAATPTPVWGGFQPAPVQSQPQGQGFPGYSQGPPVQEAPPANQPPAPQPPAEVEPPAPIPAEHQVIQDVLESLRSKCQQAASHPQVRRKLEDVSTKLDILYSKLRAGSLSSATLQGLHTILQHIWQYDYQACMQVIAGLIAGGSFAEMSDFMPGVKVLLQVAQQQGVYVEYQQQ